MQISPTSNFRIGWDSCQAIFLIYIAFIVPFRVSFNQPSMGVSFWLESMMDVYFIVDLVINFITGYEDDDTGTEVMDLKFICRNYLQVRALFPRRMDGRNNRRGQVGCACACSDVETGMGRSDSFLLMWWHASLWI